MTTSGSSTDSSYPTDSTDLSGTSAEHAPRDPAGAPAPASRARRSANGSAAPAWLLGIAGIAVFVGVWWLLTGLSHDPVISAMSPPKAFGAFPELWDRGVILGDSAASLYRLLLGLCVAFVAGVPAGLALGLSRNTELAATPVVAFLRMISPLSWAPVAVALFGIGHEPVIFLVSMAAVWPIMLATVGGVRAMNPGHIMVAKTLGASRWEILRYVVIPSVYPSVLSGVRMALGTAWIVIVPAEMLGVRSGLGYQILNARDQLAYDQVIAIILVIGVWGFVLDALANRLLREHR